MNGDALDLLALCRIRGADWSALAREAQRPEGVVRLMQGVSSESASATQQTVALISDAADSHGERREEAAELVALAEEAGADLLTVLDDEYPTNLRLIHNLPPFLFVRGKLLTQDTRSVAVVGTRHPSDEGRSKAARMAKLLAQEHVTVVSGLARGIDTEAHTAALETGGRTIAVLGSGILNTYPPENAGLAMEIVTSGQGAVVSQFWPSSPPASYNFPRRNVVTSGLSQGTVVVEASKTSGAKMQARLALEHGKKVFLLRSLVTSQDWAQRYLSRPGAVEVAEVADVVAHLRSEAEIEELTSTRQQLVLTLE